MIPVRRLLTLTAIGAGAWLLFRRGETERPRLRVKLDTPEARAAYALVTQRESEEAQAIRWYRPRLERIAVWDHIWTQKMHDLAFGIQFPWWNKSLHLPDRLLELGEECLVAAFLVPENYYTRFWHTVEAAALAELQADWAVLDLPLLPTPRHLAGYRNVLVRLYRVRAQMTPKAILHNLELRLFDAVPALQSSWPELLVVKCSDYHDFAKFVGRATGRATTK